MSVIATIAIIATAATAVAETIAKASTKEKK